MDFFTRNFTRRDFLTALTLGSAGLPALKLFTEEHLRWVESGDYAQELTLTPRITEGPFYPDKLPLDVDNDLLIIGKGDQAFGDITHLTGRVLDAKGNPLSGVTVEIWQVDGNGLYLHSQSGGPAGKTRDANFQGFGRFETASDGQYRFRTVKPVPYPGRTPHIHMKLKQGDKELLTTQCFVKGHAQNARDGVLRGVRDEKARESIQVAFEPVKDSKLGELAARFDIVLGLTPEDPR